MMGSSWKGTPWRSALSLRQPRQCPPRSGGPRVAGFLPPSALARVHPAGLEAPREETSTSDGAGRAPQAGAGWTAAPVAGVVGGACCPGPGPCPVREQGHCRSSEPPAGSKNHVVPFPNMCNDFFTDGLLPLGWSVLFWTSVSQETRESQASERLGCQEELQEAGPTMSSAAEGSADGGDNGDLSLGARPVQEAQRPHATLCSIPEGGSPLHPLTTFWAAGLAGACWWPPDSQHRPHVGSQGPGSRGGGARLRECSSASFTEVDRFKVHGAENQDPHSGPGCVWQQGCPGLWEPVRKQKKRNMEILSTPEASSLPSQWHISASTPHILPVLPRTVLAFPGGRCLCS